MYTSLELIILLLVCSVGLVALLRNAKLPPMIAYFLVGLILGPSGFSVLIDSESNRHLVEFGIVFLMFTIGLEFSLPTLNSNRRRQLRKGSHTVPKVNASLRQHAFQRRRRQQVYC